MATIGNQLELEGEPHAWIDAHAHVGWGDHWPESIRRDWMDSAGLPRTALDIDENVLLALMDSGMVESAAIFAFNAKSHLDAHVPNEYVAEIVQRHPARFIGYASVNPAEGQAAAKELEFAVKQLGLHGLKVSPTYQNYDPLDPGTFPSLKWPRRFAFR